MWRTERSTRSGSPRFLVAAMSTIFLVSGIFPASTLAANPTPTTAPDKPANGQPAVIPANDGRVVERPPVELGIPTRGGSDATALTPSAGDPSISLEPKTSGPAVDVKSLWTERSRTSDLGNGRYSLQTSAGRMNYQDPKGAWQPIDLTLVPDASVDRYGLRTTANDRIVHFGQTDAEAALARLSTDQGSLDLRALDFPSKPVSATAAAPTGAGSEPASQTPTPSPVPQASSDVASPATPAPSADPIPSVSAAASEAPVASAAASPAIPAPVMKSAASQAQSTTADDGTLRFRKDDRSGDIVIRATDEGFEFGAVLAKPDQADTYAFALNLGSLEATVADDGQTIVLARVDHLDGRDERTVVGVVDPPVLRDANEIPAPAKIVTVELYVPGSGAKPPAAVSPDALASLGATEVVLVYTIDPTWLADPGRAFPVTLDPTACLGAGASGCTINGTSGNLDHFVMNALPTQYPTGWTTFRVGYDVRSDDGATYGTMRGLVYFKDVLLPDGAMVWDTDLDLHISSEYGGPSGETITAYRINKSWGQTSTWNSWSSGAGYEASGPSASDTVPASGHMHFDVDGIVQSWYTRRGADWKPDIGIAVKMNSEGSTHGEVEFDRYNDATAGFRPLLTLTYDLPKVSIDFDPALGANYAPSAMIAGQATTLPIRVTNNSSGFDFATAQWTVAYRWFDAKGKYLTTGQTLLPACVGTGTGCSNPSATFALAVTPPATVGQYTLRLDLIRKGTIDTFGSDWATPSKYYARNKKTLTSDSTRWTGSSLIERDEFGITVVAGGTGDTRSVATADGGSLALDLYSKDLTYSGAGGVGFDDLTPLDLGYQYDAKNATDCTGIIKACGWSTSWDERLISNPAAGTYTYVGATGARSLVGTDTDAQLTSGAPVLLQRQRATLVDEAVPSNTPTAQLAVPPAPGAWSGQYAVKVPAATSIVSLGTTDTVGLNAYRLARFAVKTTSAANTGLGFQIRDDTTGVSRWLVYTLGPTDWTSGQQQVFLTSTLNGASWASFSRDLFADVSTNAVFGASTDDYSVTAVSVYNKSGSTGDVYVDAVRLEPSQTDIVEETAPTWSSGSAPAVAGDAAAGTNAIRVTSTSIASSPDCNTTLPSGTPCWSTSAGSLSSYGYVHWQWKKVGGQTAAVVFHLRDERTLVSADMTYFAGPIAPAGAINPVQVSDVTPVGWALVERNLLEDARQVLNFYNDPPSGTSPSSPPTQGPTPDAVRMTGYKFVGFDGGNFLLVDDFDYGSYADIGEDQSGHPSSQGDSTFTYDYSATYRDGSVHSFNALGLLVRVTDRNGNKVRFDWSIPDLTVAGAAGYQLDTVHAPTDATTSGSWTYDREIGLAYAGTTTRTVTATEHLGTVASPITGRTAVFIVTGSAGAGDLTAVKPARATACAASGTASDCDLFSYSATYPHMLAFVGDPRWNQTAVTAPDDLRFEVTWAGTAPNQYPSSVIDRSTGAPILRILNYNTGSALPATTRVAWQDAAGIRANDARYADITSDGRTLSESIPLPCGASNCSTLPSTANLANQRASESQFDGLARVSTSITYRCPGVSVSGCTGTSAQKIISRQSTKAGAKVDNFNDPLTAAEIGWTQSPDQYVSSLRDSAGTNVDLYRTFYQYDENGQQTSAARPAYNARPDYPAAIKNTVQSSTNLKGYWRLEETSGTAADQSGNGGTGTYTNFTAGYGSTTGALVGAPGAAPTFDGSNDYIALSSFPAVSGSYSVEAWFKPANTTSGPLTILGSRTGADKTMQLVVNLNSGRPMLYADIGSGSAWLANAIQGPIPTYTTNRWYHAAMTVNATTGIVVLYLDGQPIASAAFSGTPMLTDATRILRIGQNGLASPTQPFMGGIDEVAAFSQALTPTQVAAHYIAGRSVAVQTTKTLRDTNWRPVQVDDQFLASPGFESGLVDWDFGQGAGGQIHTATSNPASDPLVHQPTDASLPPSWASFQTNLTGNAQQDVQLVPGQTVRFQVWEKCVVTTGSARINLYYWKRSTATWTTLINVAYTDAAWTGRAWDVTLPFDTDGRVRVALWIAGATGSDSIYYDDAVLFSTYSRTDYTSVAGGDPFDGLTRNTITFAPTQSGPIAEFLGRTTYTASSSAPAIFPTTTVANYQDGTYAPSAPDTDVATTKTFDPWGHALTTTDQDGVASTTAYVGTGSDGYATDVASVANGLNETTAYQYDLVGERTRVTTPGSHLTTTTYDLRGHPLLVNDPLSLSSKDVYDAYGFRTSSIANDVDDVPSGPNGLDDLTTAYAYDEFGALTSATGNTGVSGSVGSRTTTAHDLAANTVSRSVYSTYDGTTFAGARTTTQTTDVVSGASRANPSASRGPGLFAPTGGPSPACPDGSGQYCNAVAGLDQDGQAISSTDAQGVASRTFRDLAGKPVFSIVDYSDGVYDSAAPDVDLVTTSQNDLFGRPAVMIDVLGRKTATTFDALGRPTQVRTFDSAGTAVTDTRTRYTGAGRVDRVSLPGTQGAADSTFTWTKTIYDGAGRAIKTLAHYDISLAAGLAIEAFETPIADTTIANDNSTEAWSSTAGAFIAAGATSTLQTGASSTTSGSGRLSITTGASATTGVEWALDGTYTYNHPYAARIWVDPASGISVSARLGTAADAGTVVSVSGTGAWQAIDVSWTPGADRTGARLAIYSTASAVTFHVDDAVVWDSTAGRTDWNIPTETAYDLDGQVIASVITPGVVGATEQPLVTRTTYDALGRVTNVRVHEVAGASGNDVNLDTSSTYDALGRNDSKTDPLGNITRYGYDRLGRLTSTIAHYVDGIQGGATADDDVTSRFAYDAAGELTGYCSAAQMWTGTCDETSSSNAQAWHDAYDDAGHLARQTPPVNTTITALVSSLWEFDKGGRLAKTCDGPAAITTCTSAGVLRTFVSTYDHADRPTRRDTYAGPSTTLSARVDTTYLGDGQTAQTKYSTGTTPTVVDTIDYAYDTSGRQIKQLRGATVLSERSFGPDGTISWRKDGDGNAIGQSTFAYDWAKRLASVDLPDAGFSTAVPTFAWRLDGLIAARTWSGASATFAYDGAKRVTGLTKGALTESQAYDKAGNVTAEARSFSGISGDAGTNTQAFAYDGLDRVTGSSGLTSGSRSYTYDRDSNRLTKTEGSATFTSVYDRTDELVSVLKSGGTTQSYAYDAYGNLTGDAETGLAVTAMTYDLDNHLTAIDAAGTANDATFTLDALGRFRTRVLASGTDTYSYLDTSEVVTRIDNSGGTTTDSIVSPAGDRLGVKVGATLNWFLPDLHGDVAGSLDATEATVVNATRYDAYGQTITTGTAGGSPVGTDSWKYQGRLDISPSGLATPLYDMSARFYDPGIGAFSQLDSVKGTAQDPVSLNLYLYAGANPATLTDPTGHWGQQAVCAFTGPVAPECVVATSVPDIALLVWTAALAGASLLVDTAPSTRKAWLDPSYPKDWPRPTPPPAPAPMSPTTRAPVAEAVPRPQPGPAPDYAKPKVTDSSPTVQRDWTPRIEPEDPESYPPGPRCTSLACRIGTISLLIAILTAPAFGIGIVSYAEGETPEKLREEIRRHPTPHHHPSTMTPHAPQPSQPSVTQRPRSSVVTPRLVGHLAWEL